jgi:translation initiation factor 1 (eIF-1/SUI1)
MANQEVQVVLHGRQQRPHTLIRNVDNAEHHLRQMKHQFHCNGTIHEEEGGNYVIELQGDRTHQVQLYFAANQ